MNDTPFLPKLRLFVDTPLAEGGLVEADPDQSHYLLNVMRAGPGHSVALFNGREGEWQGRIEAVRRNRCTIALESRLREQASEPDVWLLFAPIKRARIDFIAEKAGELGASLLWPVFTRFTSVSRVNEARLRAIAIEAAEQCERLTIPEIHPTTTLGQALDGWPPERRLVFLDETGGGRPIGEALAEMTPGPTAFLVGPEGGFAKTELDALRNLPFAVAVGLGPRVLRADTAALSALACWQALCGDWRSVPTLK